MPGCVQCKSKVEGELEGIPLTICCLKCCTDNAFSANRRHGDAHRITKSTARKICTRYSRRLDVLRFSTEVRRGSITYLYVRKEVEMLTRIPTRRVRSERKKRLKEKHRRDLREEKPEQKQLPREVQDRKREVETLTRVKVGEMDPVVRTFMLKDYLTTKPTVKVSSVRERCKVYSKARQIRMECTGAHPEAVFDFCVEYPQGEAKDFQELKEKVQLVFHTEAARILHNLSKAERESLKHTPLADVYAEFLKRDTRAITRCHLVELVGTETADQIMVDPACQRRLEIGGFEDVVAQKLVKFWMEKDDVEKRTNRLRAALEEYGSSIRDDCEFCEQYVLGGIDCDVDEVVAVIGIFDELRRGNMCPHGERGKIGHEEFRLRFYEQELAFDKCFDLALEAATNPGLSDECPLRSEVSSVSDDYWLDYGEWD